MSLDVSLTKVMPTEVFSCNITHNLNTMADKAGLYAALWRPEEIGVKTAEELIPFLEDGLKALRANPKYYKQFNLENGWGNYEGLVRFVEEYLQACRENPDAEVHASR